MDSNEKMRHDPLPVFIVTKTGVGFNDDGIQAVRDFVLSDDTSGAGPAGHGVTENTTGILAMTGANLLDPAALAKALSENPAARVVLSVDGGARLSMCAYGPDEDGLPAVIRALEAGTGTSWDILARATGNSGEDGGDGR